MTIKGTLFADDECSSILIETGFSRDCLNENNVIAQIG